MLNATPLIKKVPDYTTKIQQKYSTFEVDGVNVRHLLEEVQALQITSIVEEIGGWFPRVQSYIAECFPSWLDVRFSATAYDAVPTKRMIHAIAVSLSLAGNL